MNLWADIRHFHPEEFDSPDAPGSGSLMDINFLKILDKIRKDCGFPFEINSGFRTPERNALVAVVAKSSHLKGLAADIRIFDSNRRKILLKAALDNGIRRIGLARTFIHLDYSLDLPQDVVWFYP